MADFKLWLVRGVPSWPQSEKNRLLRQPPHLGFVRNERTQSSNSGKQIFKIIHGFGNTEKYNKQQNIPLPIHYATIFYNKTTAHAPMVPCRAAQTRSRTMINRSKAENQRDQNVHILHLWNRRLQELVPPTVQTTEHMLRAEKTQNTNSNLSQQRRNEIRKKSDNNNSNKTIFIVSQFNRGRRKGSCRPT